MPHILVRFMAIKDEKELKTSKKVAIVWVILGLGFACFIGILGRAYLAVKHGVIDDSEKVFIEMIKQLFTDDINLALIAGIGVSVGLQRIPVSPTTPKIGNNLLFSTSGI